MSDREASQSPTADELTVAVRSSAMPVALWDLVSLRVLAISGRGANVLGLEPSAEDVDWLSLLADPEPARRGLESIRSGLFDAYRARRSLRLVDGKLLELVACVRVVDEDRRLAIAAFVPWDKALAGEFAFADVDAAIGTLDDAGRIRQISSDVTPLLGYLPAACLGLALESLLHPADAGLLFDVLSRVISDDANVAADVRVRAADGSWRPVHLTLGPVSGDTTTFSFAAGPVERVMVGAGGAGADRIAELEQRLSRIAREVEAAGLAGRGVQIPDSARVPGLSDLTSRQGQILTRLLQGERVPTIARALFLSPSTIRNHLSLIYKKLGVHSQAELIEKFQPTE